MCIKTVSVTFPEPEPSPARKQLTAWLIIGRAFQEGIDLPEPKEKR